MIVAYHIHKGDLDAVEEDYDKFNKDFYQLIQDFSKVTGEEFRSGFGDEQGNLLKDIDNYLGAVQNLIGLEGWKNDTSVFSAYWYWYSSDWILILQYLKIILNTGY